MVVCKHRDIYWNIHSVLEPHGFDFLLPDSSRDPIAVAEEQGPDIVLIEMAPPSWEGLDTLERIKDNLVTATIPVFMIMRSEHYDNTKMQYDAYRKGAVGIMKYPFENDLPAVMVTAQMHQIDTARHKCVITGLYSEPMMEKEIQMRIDNHKKFAVIYIAVGFLEALRQKYGETSGDDVLRGIGAVLRMAKNEVGDEADVIAQTSIEDFVYLTTPEKVEIICPYIIDAFDKDFLPAYYTDEDYRKGYIEIETRKGEKRQIPLMVLSMGIVTNEKRGLTHYREVMRIATECRGKALENRKSCYVKDRRTV